MVTEELLKLVCRRPDEPDLIPVGGDDLAPGSAPLASLRRAFGHFDDYVSGTRVLDFGCGIGQQVIAMARECGALAAGIDRNERYIERAKVLAGDTPVEFTTRVPHEWHATFDVVVSHNSMEHFSAPGEVLRDMLELLKPGGVLLISFSPPWYSPYGAHQHFWCYLPWVHLVFSERTVLKVRQRYCSDSPKTYEETGLNRMSLAKFEALTGSVNVVSSHYSCVKGIDWLSKIPICRELFVNNVAAVIRK